MKTRLLYLLLFICSYTYAQIPTTGLLGQYELNNGDVSDISANAVHFSQTGTNSVNVANRFNTANSAIALNGDILTRTNLNFTDAAGESGDKAISYSFWIKTNTNSADKKTIIGDSERPLEPLTGNDTGYYIYLKDGKIGANSRVRYHNNQSNQALTSTRGLNLLSTTIISDNNWHHVVVSLGQRYINNTASFIRYEITADITIDNQTTQSLGDQVVAAFSFNEGIDRPGNMVVGNNRTEALTTTNKYEDSIDDIYIYKRELTASEITNIYSEGNFCSTPNVSVLSHNNATSSSASIAIAQSGTFDLAYVPQGQPFANAQVVSNITTGNTSLTGLLPLTTYDVYIREQCSNTTAWSAVAYNFTTPGTVYVNQNATGANSGLNWTDAFTSLTDALTLASENSEIWIAAGTYTPVAGNRNNTFTLSEDNINIYGGFVGTETLLSQRDFRTNITTISGDINGDDSGVDFAESTRSENIYHILTISGNNTLIDGVVISGGQADATSGDERFGAGIRKENTAQGITLKNSIFENNVAVGGGGFYGQFIVGDFLNVENSIFRNNVVTYAGGIYTTTVSSANYTVTLTNSLFHNNTSKDRSATSKGFTGSGVWLRANTSGSSLISAATNCSFVNNSDIGTQASEHGVFGLSRVNNSAFHSFTGANNIFYHNKDANGNAALTLNDGHTNFLNSGHVYNSIAQDGFARFNVVDQTNTSDVDPLFTDYLNNDFTLQGSSPAKDTGDNSYINLPEDLAGNQRVIDGVVDMGVYEKTFVCGEVGGVTLTENPLNNTEGIVTWSHGFNTSGPFDLVYVEAGQPIGNGTVISNLTSESYTLTTLTPNTYYDIYVRTYCNGNPTNYVMGTSGFRTPIFVNHQSTGNNDGSSWQDAFTLLQDALAIAEDGEEIWVAGGTYKPSTSNRGSYYVINKENLKIYGGFSGTELQLSQRVLGTNETKLSGDVLGNDVNTTAFVSNYGNTTRSADNTYRVINITNAGNNLVLDGFTVSDAHNNASSTSRGAAIIKHASISHLTLKNCIIKDNVGRNDNAGLMAEFDLNNASGTRGALVVENCQFINNMSRWASGLYTFVRTNTLVDFRVENSLFSKNIAANLSSSVTGHSASAAWFRLLNSTSNATLKLNNNTYVDNLDTGTAGSATNATRAPVLISRGPSTTSPFTAEVSNCIFWNNKGTSNVTIKAISDLNQAPASSLNVYNSLDPLNFVESSITSAVNTVTTDPLFNNAANGDYTLIPTSPAINTGDNAFVTLTTDILNNTRISGSIVDMGAYELPVNCGDVSNFNVVETSINSGEALITWEHPFNAAGPFDLVYVESGQPIGNGTLVSNLITNTYTATGIPSQSSYDYYVRVYCSGVPSAYIMITKTLNSPLFVNHSATGANDGTSWTNAFTNLDAALAAAQDGKSIWIAGGTYRSSTSARNVYFIVNNQNLTIYGGFSGTEVDLSERVLGANETILSGDVQGNDINVTGFVSNYGNTTRNADNTYRVINILATANNLVLDGLTISDAHNNAGTTSVGAAILKEKSISHLTLRNCIIKNNVSRNANAGLLAEFDLNNVPGNRGALVIENSKFINNMSRWGTAIYSYARSNTNVDITIANTLFDGNISGNLNTSTALSISGSAGWFRMLGNTADMTLNFANNTLVNNIDNGTGQSLNATSHAVLAISAESGLNGTFNAEIANNIFWNNKTTGNAATRSITDLYKLPVTSVNVYNSIDESNFNDSSITSTTMISNADPLFENLAGGDYTLASNSSAIDSGDNTYVLGTTDLIGNTRIENTTVDMGCYEYVSLAINIDIDVFLQGAAINPNSGEETLMRDDLRIAGIIPTVSPYLDNLVCNASVFTVTGNNAIVDWIWVELRDANDNTSVIQSKSAFLQRDGDVVDVDGTSNLSFTAQVDNYYVVLKHRNHLGVMSANTVALSGNSTNVDFTDANNQITFGTDAQTTSGMSTGLIGMWAGNANGDGVLNYLGAQSEVPSVENQVFNDPANSFFGGPPVGTYGSLGYSLTDVNMDGVTYYLGALSDALFVRDNIFNNPSNSFFGGPPVGTYTFNEQLP